MNPTERKPRRGRTTMLALAVAAMIPSLPALANGIDSRVVTCEGLHALIAQHGFVFISQATFGDFVVADRGFCVDADILELRSVATSDAPECPVNYCVSRSTTSLGGGGM